MWKLSVIVFREYMTSCGLQTLCNTDRQSGNLTNQLTNGLTGGVGARDAYASKNRDVSFKSFEEKVNDVRRHPRHPGALFWRCPHQIIIIPTAAQTQASLPILPASIRGLPIFSVITVGPNIFIVIDFNHAFSHCSPQSARLISKDFGQDICVVQLWVHFKIFKTIFRMYTKLP